MNLKDIQTKLLKKGYNPGPIDGVWGSRTEAAIAAAIDAAPQISPIVTALGSDLLALAKTRVGETYVYGAHVPLQDANWHGPWDCAEFVTWVVYQLTGNIYGCIDNTAQDPDPYTGGWRQDVLSGTVDKILVSKAASTPGAILLRYREGGKHVVFCVGDSSTIEAKGSEYGVCTSRVGSISAWDYGILIPGIKYD